MSLSVVIPTFNAQATVTQCLTAVFSSSTKDIEIILVDDASSDETLSLARQFPCRIIKLAENKGPANARSVGRQRATSPIVVFIDSDIVIEPDTLSRVTSYFSQHPETTALVGMNSKRHPSKNFFSQYKNLYMHFVLRNCTGTIDFIYGSFFAIRNDPLFATAQETRIGEDTELGLLLTTKGKKIVLDKTLRVTHLKEHSFLSLLKNDFLVPYHWAHIFLRQRGWSRLASQRRFAHASFKQIIGIAVAWGTLLCAIPLPLLSLCSFTVWLITAFPFLRFLKQERGVDFFLKASLLAWIDSIVMGTGILCGTLRGVTFFFQKQ